MKALVFSANSLFKFSSFGVTDDWFISYGLPDIDCGIKRVKIGDNVFFIEDTLDDDQVPIVVINVSEGSGVFSGDSVKPQTLDRIITVARSMFTTTVLVPATWRPHHEDSLLSIQAPSKSRNWKARLHFDTHMGPTDDLYVFQRTDEIKDFDALDRSASVFESARSKFAEAILEKPQIRSNDSAAGIFLTERLPQGFVQNGTLDDWYEKKLTEDQLKFVDKKYNGPVRLRGAAGTGKTLSLVIKFLRDARKAKQDGKALKLCLIAHSNASIDLVVAIAESLDNYGLLHSKENDVILEIRTLYDLAYEYLRFNEDNLNPLSLDGREGRLLQGELIQSVLKEMNESEVTVLRFDDIDPSLKKKWEAVVSGEDNKLIADLMNEFASVLDAEGVRQGEEKGEIYVKGKNRRPAWLMSLPNELDRRFVLEVHRRYREELGGMDALSVDQMVGDFNAFLDSNRWDRVRNRQGYDALFVDELHLFTSIERQTLHKLIKVSTDECGRPKRPPIFMAYDLKQSPRDTFSQYLQPDQNLFSSSTGLQNSDLVKLEKVFRYTPQIAEFLADLDASFPAIDVPGEWDAYAGDGELSDGDRPDLRSFKEEVSLFRTIFTEAHRIARKTSGGGRRVAVLCVSEKQFGKYLTAASGQYRGRHIPITGRDSSSELRHAGNRFVFSMPEYVAGLQFDTVFVINVDTEEAPADAGIGERRRFISNVYLGCSRAEKTLHVVSCTARGGVSDILRMALDRGSLVEVP